MPRTCHRGDISLRGGKHVEPKIKLNHAGAKLLHSRHLFRTSFVMKVNAGRATTRKTGKLIIKIKTGTRKHR
jgi:hypothetical protein